MRNHKKKREEPQEEGSPAWMNTYGDMVTLLLAFFVLLFSFSTIDAQKWEKLVSALSGTTIVAIDSIDPEDVQLSGIQETEDQEDVETEPDEMVDEENGSHADIGNTEEIRKRFNELYEKLKNHIEENELEDKINIYEEKDTILIRMMDSALFDSGSVEIKDNIKVILLEMCRIFQEYVELIQEIQIEGHTDNVPVDPSKVQDNWELSTDRATEVVRFFIDNMDIDPAIMTPLGHGEYHPVASNDTEEGRAANRRVDFVVESILKD